MRFEKATVESDIEDMDDDDEDPGEEVESAKPLRVGEEREIGSSGVKKKLLKRGHGWETPALGDEATVHYVGTLLDGKMFDSTRDRDKPLAVKLGHEQVYRELEDGITTMTKGEIALFTFPAGLSYDVVPPKSVVRFEVELVSWLSISNVTEDGGIVKNIIARGDKNWVTGVEDEVLVKYRAELIDGTIVAESPGVEFYVKDGHLCPAIPKAILTMTKGEKARLIVQSHYAYGEHGREAIEGFPSIPPSSILNIDIELVSFKPVIDVIGDGKVLKKIIKVDQGAQSADEGATVTISYTARLEDGSVFEKKGIDGETPLKFVTDEEQVISGLDIAAATMQKGEESVLTIHPDYGFGDVEVKRDLSVVPPCSTLAYEVVMLDFVKEKAPWKMKNNERIEAAGRKKEEGNLLFKSGKHQRAAKKYDKAVEYISEEVSFGDDELKLAEPLRVSCWLNGAACSLKLNDFHRAINLCSKVLDIEFHNLKALYRRAQGYVGIEDLVLADLDIKKALEVDPENREVKLIKRSLKQLEAERNNRDAKLYVNMFARETKKSKVDKTSENR